MKALLVYPLGNVEWMTPLHFATEVGESEVVAFLVDKGATVTIQRKYHHTYHLPF